MFSKLKRLFSRRSAAAAGARAPQPDTGADKDAAIWRTADDPANPFVMEGVDCAAFTHTMLSTTTNPAVAESFVRLRSDNGQGHVNQYPADAHVVECRLSYAAPAQPVDGPLFKAQEMEEKWDIYMVAKRLYFARSWMGELALVAEFEHVNQRIDVQRIWAVPALADLAVQQVDYLIKSHILGRVVPHPLPPELGRDVQAIALYSSSMYGRVSWFGTFADTLLDQPLKHPPKAASNHAAPS